MMHISPYWLTAIFVFVVVLLCAGTIYSRIHWALKAILISSSLVMFFVFYVGYIGALGWPVRDSLPVNFRFLAADIRPPMDANDAGAIFVWIVPIEPDRQLVEPRSVKLRYSKAMHKKMSEALKKEGDGEDVYMTGEKTEAKRRALMRPWSFYDEDTPPDFTPPPMTMPEK